MSRSILKPALALAALALTACFGVEKIDPGPADAGRAGCGTLLVDDFEDGNPFPSLSKFGRWGCFTFNPTVNPDAGQNVTCDLEPGFDSSNALYTAFELQDPEDGKQDFTGTGVFTQSPTPLDVSSYEELVFSARVDSGAAGLPINSRFEALLYCHTATGASGPFDPNDPPTIRRSALLTDQWQAIRLELASFAQPEYQTNHVVGGTARCLGRVDGIGFQISTDLPDGRAASGRLHIDDVYFDGCRQP